MTTTNENEIVPNKTNLFVLEDSAEIYIVGSEMRDRSMEPSQIINYKKTP